MPATNTRPFSWSWSRLKNFRTCPKRSWHLDIAKDIREEEGPALVWGHEVHEALATSIDKGKPLPVTMEQYEHFPARFAKLKNEGYKVLVENKLAMTEKFTGTGFFDKDTWFRGVADVLVFSPVQPVVGVFDWKTGKVSPEFEQLQLTAQLIFANYPEIEEVATAYIWLGFDAETKQSYRRDEMVPFWNRMWPAINTMIDAHKHTNYPPKPSGLCVHHCPVTSCPYHGKGSR